MRSQVPPWQRAWVVGPYKDEWVIIVHRASRSEARLAAASIDPMFMDMIDMRARRLPLLDGQVPSLELLRSAGWSEEYLQEADGISGYIMECGCELCKQAMQEERGHG